MSADEFDRMFGDAVAAQRPGFAQRIRPDDADLREPPSPEEDPLAGSYRAFGCLPAGFGETCDVQRWLDGTDTPEGLTFQYRFLMEISFVGETELRLFLPDCLVLIEGKNLRELRRRLARRQVTFVQQYSARVWPGEQRQGEALVARIDIVRGGAA